MATQVQTTTPTHLLTDTIVIQRVSFSQGSAGGQSKSYAAHLSGVKARVQPISSSEALRYGRESTRALARFLVDGSLDIIETDRIVFESNNYDIFDKKDNQNARVLMRLVAQKTVV